MWLHAKAGRHNNSSRSFHLTGFEPLNSSVVVTEAVPTDIPAHTNVEWSTVALKAGEADGGHAHYLVAGVDNINIDYQASVFRSASVTPVSSNSSTPYCTIEMGEVPVGGGSVLITFDDDSSNIFATRGLCLGGAALDSANPTATVSPASGATAATPTPVASPGGSTGP
jgi:hypothetical protein